MSAGGRSGGAGIERLEREAVPETGASAEAAVKSWKPQGVSGWLLTVPACLLTGIMTALGYCMLIPVRWDGPGKIAEPSSGLLS